MERLSPDDRLLLMPDRRWPQDVGVIALLDGGPLLDRRGRVRVEMALDALSGALPAMPRLRQTLRVPRRGLGGPLWVDAQSFDLRDHVRVGAVAGGGGEADLLEAVELVRRRRLDPSRPLWELWLLPGLADGRLGMFVRMHHVMADGVAGIAILTRLLADPSPAERRGTIPWPPAPEPSSRELLLDNLATSGRRLGRAVRSVAHPAAGVQAMRSTLPAVRELVAGEPGPVTSLGGVVGPHRSLQFVRAELADVTAVARANAATVNDVLLAMIAGGTRTLLESRGERVDGFVLPIYVPVSLRRPGGSGRELEQGNEISQMLVPLPVGLEDPVARLHRITASTTERKALTRPLLAPVFRGRVVSAVLLQLIIRQRANLLSADLIGPSHPLSFAGAPVLEAFPLINLLGNITLGVGALSYAGAFEVLVVGDADLHPDLDVFAAAAAAELRALAAAPAERRRA